MFTYTILRTLTFLGIDLCKLCKPDVITYSHTYFTKCCKERHKLCDYTSGESKYIKVTLEMFTNIYILPNTDMAIIDE